MQAQLKVQACIELQEEFGSEGRNIGCWSVHQNLLYCIFVDQNKSIMISKKKRKKMRIFDMMSKFIGSRNSLQCRSHHQKFVEKFRDIKQILGAFKNFFGKQCYKENYRVYTGKKVRHIQGLRPLFLKNQENQSIDYELSISAENDVQKKPQENPQKQFEQKKIGDEMEVEQRKEGQTAVCKAQQPIQYYTPYSYYIGNNFLPYPFFAQFYTLQNTQ